MRYFAALALVLSGFFVSGEVLAAGSTKPVSPLQPLSIRMCLEKALSMEEGSSKNGWVCYIEDGEIKLKFFEEYNKREEFKKKLDENKIESIGFPLVM